jgi:hypothetical protein
MVKSEHRYRDTSSDEDRVTPQAFTAESATPAGSPLRYSSPWPWIRALAIGIALWSGILWLIWHFIA